MWRVAFAALFLFFAGCAPKTAPPFPPATSPLGPSYIDLQPGWRLRVVTPLLRSGGYRLRTGAESTEGNTATLSAGDEFLGYETSYYAVKQRRGGGVRVNFDMAEVTRDGETSRQARPLERLFQIPWGAKHVRLIYLQRVSEADHEMAAVAAERPEALDALTEQVRAAPEEACGSGRRAHCSWIPAGISVLPEMRRASHGSAWVPAR
jgi:hypothetical protein